MREKVIVRLIMLGKYNIRSYIQIAGLNHAKEYIKNINFNKIDKKNNVRIPLRLGRTIECDREPLAQLPL